MSTSNPPDETEERKDVESEAVAQAKAEDEPSADGLDGVEAAEIDGPVEPDLKLEQLQARAKKLDPIEVQRILESLLFVSAVPLTAEAVEKATGIAPDASSKGFGELASRYAQQDGGVVLHEVAGGWQLRSAAASSEYVRRLLQLKPQRLTRAALETLAIIAYRQPITRPEVEDVRAVDSGAIIKALLERKLIKILGKKEEPGHPLLYGTTREFLEFFNLKNLASLPTLREFQELTEESRDIVEKEHGTPEPIAGTVSQLADAEFLARQKKSTEASEAALEELETAMAVAEKKAKETHDILNPPPPPQPAVEGAAPMPAPQPPEHDTQPEINTAQVVEAVAQEQKAEEKKAEAKPPRKRKAKDAQAEPKAEAAPEPEVKE
ncbi:MAG: SMC-Scp complex subunit ScpB [Deltaproteobacteria bacterium]|nr:SMC-Scp complex subunit ScpB [Deltaproteobacteria bacterium]